MSRRTFVFTACSIAAACSIVAAGPAFAHVSVDQKSVPPSSDAVLRFNVPVEGADHSAGRPDLDKRHNVKVTVEIPAGFTAGSCEAKAGWACKVNPAAGKAPHHVAFTRSGGPYDAVDSFNVKVRTAAEPGSYAFETNQTYSEGDVSHWDGSPDSSNPAPVVTVG